MIHGTDNKRVFIFSDGVLDVSVDELIDRFKELGDKNISVIKHIKDNKVLVDTNETFVDVFGWTDEETKRFRDKRGSGDWLKEHRSLVSWKYQTKDRKTGKVYSWNNQSKDDVEKWLSSNQSLDVKKVEMV